MELVDILLPPDFHKNGQTKTRDQAINDADWLGGFHLWVIKTEPDLGLIFQIRSENKTTFPGKLDVTAAGHYQAGETVKDGLREVQEEIGKVYSFDDLTYLGKKVFVGFDQSQRKLQTVCDVFFLVDNSPLKNYQLQEAEVQGLVVIPIPDLLKVFKDPNYTFTADAINLQGESLRRTIKRTDFIENWDNYQYKIALLTERFIRGETDLFY